MNELWIGIASVLAVLLLAALLWILARFILLIRVPGAVQCSMRRPDHKWRTGVMILGQDSLQWYRTRSISPVPRRVIARGSFTLVSHRPSKDDPDTTIIKLMDGDTTIVVAMGTSSFAGLVSWIDSAPPGIISTGL